MKGDTKIWKWGGFGVVKGHSRSLKIAPFDRAHTSSYYRLIAKLLFRNCQETLSFKSVTDKQTNVVELFRPLVACDVQAPLNLAW